MNRRTSATVLLFDPHVDSRSGYADALRAAGCHVQEAVRDDTALALAQHASPHVIVVTFDVSTRHDRLRFCREVKAAFTSGSPPILLLTSTAATEDDVELAMDPGVMVLSVPPDAATKLVAAVQGVMAARRPAPLRAALKPHRKRKTGES